MFSWVIAIFVKCFYNNDANVCNAGVLFLEVGRVGLPDMFRFVVLELLAVSIITEIVCLVFLVFSIFLFSSMFG